MADKLSVRISTLVPSAGGRNMTIATNAIPDLTSVDQTFGFLHQARHRRSKNTSAPNTIAGRVHGCRLFETFRRKAVRPDSIWSGCVWLDQILAF